MSIADGLLVFVDFGSTLFSHQQFGGDWRRAFARRAGISYEQFVTEEIALRPIGEVILVGCPYVSSQDQPRTNCQCIYSPDYLYPDASAFMQTVTAVGLEQVILTFGSQLS